MCLFEKNNLLSDVDWAVLSCSNHVVVLKSTIPLIGVFKRVQIIEISTISLPILRNTAIFESMNKIVLYPPNMPEVGSRLGVS